VVEHPDGRPVLLRLVARTDELASITRETESVSDAVNGSLTQPGLASADVYRDCYSPAGRMGTLEGKDRHVEQPA
jgi:hypothetical protein